MLADRVRIGSNSKDNMINIRVYDTSNYWGEVYFTPLLVPIEDETNYDKILNNLGPPIPIKGSTIDTPINIKTSGGRVIVCKFNGIPMNLSAYLNGVKHIYETFRMDYGILVFKFDTDIKDNDLIEINVFFD